MPALLNKVPSRPHEATAFLNAKSTALGIETSQGNISAFLCPLAASSNALIRRPINPT